MTQQECELMIEEEKLHLEKFGSEGRGIFTRLTYAVEQLKDHQHQQAIEEKEREFAKYLTEQCAMSQIENEMRFGDGTGTEKPNYEHVVNRALLRYSHSKKDEVDV